MTATIPIYNVTKFRPAFDTVAAFTSDQTLAYTVSDAASGLYRVDVGDKIWVGDYLVEVLSSGSTGDLANNSSTPVQVALTRNVIMDARQFGSIDVTGATDASSVIQDAADYMRTEAAGGTLYIPGKVLLSSAVDFSGPFDLRGDGPSLNAGLYVTDSSLLEPVTFGATSIWGGKIDGLNVIRSGYSGATENKGFVIKDAAWFEMKNSVSRLSKYPAFLDPQDGGRVGYCGFSYCEFVGGYYNVSGQLTGSGYANKIKFDTCGFVNLGNTVSHVYIDFNCNRISLIDNSMEDGSGSTPDQAIYINGTSSGGIHSVAVVRNGMEGTFTNDPIVIGANCQRILVDQIDNYATVDNTAGATACDLRLATGNYKEVTNNGSVAQTNVNKSATDSTNTIFRSVRDNATSFAWEAIRDSDGLVRAYCSTRGDFYGLTGWFEGTGYTNPNLRLDDERIWPDSTQDLLRQKGSAPSSATDGYFIGGTMPTTTTAALVDIADTVNTQGKKAGTFYLNTTTGLPVYAAGATAGDVWATFDGVTAHTPA